MSAPEKTQVKEEQVPGPKSVESIKDRLQTMAAFAFLGKRAFMEGDLTEEGWEKYLESIESPFSVDGIREVAFEALFKMAGDAWTELFDPMDAIEGKPIDRTIAAPEGDLPLSEGPTNTIHIRVSLAVMWERLTSPGRHSERSGQGKGME